LEIRGRRFWNLLSGQQPLVGLYVLPILRFLDQLLDTQLVALVLRIDPLWEEQTEHPENGCLRMIPAP
jgi:hypothetical protein